MAVMLHATWMSETKRNIFNPRSTELKAIDTALENYEIGGKTTAQLITLKKALDAWIAWTLPLAIMGFILLRMHGRIRAQPAISARNTKTS